MPLTTLCTLRCSKPQVNDTAIRIWLEGNDHPPLGLDYRTLHVPLEEQDNHVEQ